jgi:hypothetical protein
MSEPVAIQFALVSHTNNGKTTLARTLVGMDVGEVRDAAHVTVLAESHLLLASPEGDTLQLWDTPGFGDSVRLMRRLAIAGNPIGWFLREVLDRYRDKPFWLSQVALRTAKESADVVLYLVNSAEDPQDAGYLPAEMKILAWLGRPVVVLLNQLGPPRPAPEEQKEQARWRQHLSRYEIVRGVLALDAFARCWVHEKVFYEAVGRVLEPAKREGYARLLAVWEGNNLSRFEDAMRVTAQLLLESARDTEAIETGDAGLLKSAMKAVGLGKAAQEQLHKKAMKVLLTRLNARIVAATTKLLVLHKLDSSQAVNINNRVAGNLDVRAPIDVTQAGLLGGVISGAATGLKVDLIAGGMTFGAGALIGGIVGALTAAGAAWSFNTTTDRNQATVQFADDLLHSLLVGSILRYLAVAHFGRGRGNFVEGEAPPFWQAEVERALAPMSGAWEAARSGDGAPLETMVRQVTRTTLAHLYPGMEHLSQM